jgi:DNA-binding NtrC family response regulator
LERGASDGFTGLYVWGLWRLLATMSPSNSPRPAQQVLPSRLLLIDDDPAGLLALAELIQRRLEDAVVDTALDVHAALELLREKDYHTVISDIRMGGLDGLALLNQVRERWPEVPVILITAAGREREREAFREGAYFFIEKPIDADQLLAALGAAIERSRVLYRIQVLNRESLRHLAHEAERMEFGSCPSPNNPST